MAVSIQCVPVCAKWLKGASLEQVRHIVVFARKHFQMGILGIVTWGQLSFSTQYSKREIRVLSILVGSGKNCWEAGAWTT